MIFQFYLKSPKTLLNSLAQYCSTKIETKENKSFDQLASNQRSKMRSYCGIKNKKHRVWICSPDGTQTNKIELMCTSKNKNQRILQGRSRNKTRSRLQVLYYSIKSINPSSSTGANKSDPRPQRVALRYPIFRPRTKPCRGVIGSHQKLPEDRIEISVFFVHHSGKSSSDSIGTRNVRYAVFKRSGKYQS